VDQEVARLLREAEERAVAMLNDHRDALDYLAERLMEQETIDGKVVLEVLQGKKQLVSHATGPGPAGPGGSASSAASGSAPGGPSGPAPGGAIGPAGPASPAGPR
jgi:cell division protease FtsH